MSLERLGWTKCKWAGIGFGFWETFDEIPGGNHYTEAHFFWGWWVFRFRIWVHLPEPDVRQWYHYPIEMPINKDGNGPCSIEEAAALVYEVWDRDHRTLSSHRNLPDAINDAMRRNHNGL